MSGLEGLGIASSVMAVITFALDTVKLCKVIIDTGSADPNLDENAKNTRKTSDNLQSMLSKQRPNSTEAETRLRAIASSCVQCAKDIEKEVADISPQKAGVFAAMKSTVKTMRRKGRLDKLKNQLEAWKNTMDSAVIVQILNECIASGELHRNAYEKYLSQEQKNLVATYEQRSKAIEDLIRQVPDHVTAEHVETRHVLTQRADLSEVRDYEKQAYERLLESLKYPRMDERKNSVPRRHMKTLEWIFGATENDNFERDDMEVDADSDGPRSSRNSEEDPMIVRANDRSAYQKWKDQAMRQAEWMKQEADIFGWLRRDDDHLYWISGKPGSGKSTLMKFIATDERTKTVLRDWDPKPSIISHFLWKPGSPLQQSLHGLLCSLLYQILSEDIDVAHHFIRNSLRLQMKSEESDWDMEDLEKLLFQAVRLSPRAYFILLDGLDELSKPHGGMNRLFGLLDKLVAEDRVKVCVSSRPKRLFMDRFGSNPMLRMQDFTHGDIINYTIDVLESITAPSEDSLLPKIAEEICSRAEGVFIWVHVVLQNVKTGIEEFDETWEDIYDRIIELPPDIMNLYKDMCSRLGGSNKKYIKKAARYFQHVRYGAKNFHACKITTLSISDDETLDAFTKSDKILPVSKLIKMCENTFKTLVPISAGLLQVHEPLNKHETLNEHRQMQISENELQVIAWDCMIVEIIHRTALDFLNIDEGIDLFGESALDDDIFLPVFIKGELILRSATGYEKRPLQKIWRKMRLTYTSAEEGVKRVVDDLLPLVHRHAIDKNRDLLLLENCESVSRQHKFLFEAALHGFYEYIENWLRSTGNYEGPATTYVLLGSCHNEYTYDRFSYHPSQRQRRFRQYRLIQDLLGNYTRHGERLEAPAVFNTSDNIMLAWRCFLLEESRITRRGFGDKYKPEVEETLAAFIAAGVMTKSPQPKYLISSSDTEVSIVDNRDLQYEVSVEGESVIYAEVNDVFFLWNLLASRGETSNLIPAAGTVAFIRLVLFADAREEGANCKFFRLSSDESKQKELVKYFFSDVIDSVDTADSNPFFGVLPGYVEGEDIGEFPSVREALNEIGYRLPEVNMDYFCAEDRWM